MRRGDRTAGTARSPHDVDWREEAARLRRLARRLDKVEPEPPLPPPMPPARIEHVPGRGELFVRQAAGPEGVPTVLLLHGWTASADLNWWRAYEAVSAMAPLLAMDVRGHGRGLRSEETFTLEAAADDAAALIEHLGIGPVLVCGYSMGGPISMLLWQRHPHLVSGLVLEATALEWRSNARERITWKAMGILELVLRAGPTPGLVERVLRDAIEDAPDLAAHRSWVKAELRRGDPPEIASAGRALGLYDARGFAGTINVATAVVITTEDRLVRPRKQRALAEAIPGAEVFELVGDHDACLVSPEEFAFVTVDALTHVLSRVSGDPVEGAGEAARLA